MSTPLIGRFEHLPKRPKSDEARPLLEKIASQVKPIMTKRNWKVGTLAEFLPADPALLGVNTGAGHRINLRLRPPGDPSTFYEFDQLVLVMLHELTHNVHGPHDAKFYKLLAELEEEFHELKRKGYSGEGFHGEGNHLPGIKLNEYEGRAKGLQAAQKRFDVQKTMGKGGVLGGSNVKGRSMKEVLAEAAERRMRDDKSCKTQDHGQSKEVQDEVRKAQEESVGVDAIDLTGDSDDEVQVVDVQPKVKLEPKALDATETTSPSQPIQPPNLRAQQSPQKAKAAGSTVRKTHTSAPYPPPRQPAPAPKSPRPEEPLLTLPSGEWSCPTCTLLNGPRSLACEACTTPKPRPTQSKKGNSWWCEFCGAGPRDMEFWSCLECGWVRKWG